MNDSKEQVRDALRDAITRCKTQSAMAEKLGDGYSQQLISYWLKSGVVRPEHAIRIEQKIGISRHLLAPDVFGPPSGAESMFAATA